MKHAIWAFAAIITVMFVAILLFAIPRFDSVAPSDARARHIEDPTSEDPQQVAPEQHAGILSKCDFMGRSPSISRKDDCCYGACC